jgi:hypothetical protein
MTATAFVPRCVQRTGKECGDCVECLSVIPFGKTCADCGHASRCKAFGFTSSMENRYCSFYPSHAVVRIAV